MKNKSFINHIAIFMANLKGGGAERAGLNLAKGMAKRAKQVDLVLGNKEGEFVHQIPNGVKVVDLGVSRMSKAIIPLAKYLYRENPQILVSYDYYVNVVALITKFFMGVFSRTKIIVVEQNNFAQSIKNRKKYLLFLMKWFYPQSDAIIGVSDGVARDLETCLNLNHGTVKTIWNPIVDEDLINQSNVPLEHSWFKPNSLPVFLAVGRLQVQKDFFTLLQAFALMRQKRPAKLIILGEGELRKDLEAMVNELKLADHVSLPGFANNPYSYMKKSIALVLSSRFEGLPTVLPEALACGCPVVATNCPNGPSEILDNGKYGMLVPVGNPGALAEAMLKIIDLPINREILIQRAQYFQINNVVSKYLSLFEQILSK